MASLTSLIFTFLVATAVTSRGIFAIPMDKIFHEPQGMAAAAMAFANGDFPGGPINVGGGYRSGHSMGESMRWNTDARMAFNRGYDYDNKRREVNFSYNDLADKNRGFPGSNRGMPRHVGGFGEQQSYSNRYNTEWKSKDGMSGGFAYGNSYGPRQYSWAYGFGPDKMAPGKVNFVHVDSEKGMTRGQAPADEYFRTFPGRQMHEDTMRNIHNIRTAVQNGFMHPPPNMFRDMSHDFRKFMMGHM